jgi:hypothetical protein
MDAPGNMIAAGRDADIFEYGTGTSYGAHAMVALRCSKLKPWSSFAPRVTPSQKSSM